MRPTSGLAPAPKSVGQLDAELNFHGRARHAQRLQVGVSGDEFDAFHAGVNHAVDGVASAAAHADDLDLGVVAGFFVKADANVGVFVFFHVRRLILIFVHVRVCLSSMTGAPQRLKPILVLSSDGMAEPYPDTSLS